MLEKKTQPAVTTGQDALDPRPKSRSATPSDTEVGRRIKVIRWKAGLTQKQVGARIGVSGAQFHRYETGDTRVAASRLLDIAKALDVPVTDLVGIAQPREAPPHAADAAGSDELVELVEMFSSIEDHRRRVALVSFARSLAAAPEAA